MTQQSLKSNKLIDSSDDIFALLRSARQGESDQLDDFLNNLKNIREGEHKEKVVTVKRWVTLKITDPTGKTKVQAERRTQYVKVKNLANQALEDFANLKDHLERNAKIKTYIAEKRNFVKESENQAMIYIDWSECGTFKQPGI